jgi:hypothetical protein
LASKIVSLARRQAWKFFQFEIGLGSADITRQLMNQGIAELQTKGLSEEDESRGMKKTFQEIAALGYEHIHTLKVIPADGREPYFVHIDSIDRE